ncbi:hypothetical protein SAY87_031464 [Trapa incisa]|uniref:Uncharacterized protein n=2 Tax=Trapa TaxID=22665 RepID=A0AAN7RCN8_TRANT|nr:hypothetical protein SAY87_031464 [Trapa incisa]KAK4795541.1 hypothetical protein SAY86_027867 [Trapa natans]
MHLEDRQLQPHTTKVQITRESIPFICKQELKLRTTKKDPSTRKTKSSFWKFSSGHRNAVSIKVLTKAQFINELLATEHNSLCLCNLFLMHFHNSLIKPSTQSHLHLFGHIFSQRIYPKISSLLVDEEIASRGNSISYSYFMRQISQVF